MLPAPFRAMDPADDLAWLAVADWFEEHDQPERAELVRLTQLLRHDLTNLDRPRREDRLRELLAAGVEPCVATLTNSIGMVLAYIPAGTFLMGSPEEEADRSGHEGPVHEVTVAKAFYLGMYAVTQGEYEAVMRKNPSYFSANGDGKDEVKGRNTSRFPVESVTYEDAVKFCEKLSARKAEQENERMYRLPSEAEWEYACRGETGSLPFHFGKTLSSDQANFIGDYPYEDAAKGPYLGQTCEVGSYRANGFGLCDMHGNVWEWCSDWYDEDYYADSPAADPSGGKGSARVIRGGGYNFSGRSCRSARRSKYAPSDGSTHFGFRVALVSRLVSSARN